MGFGQPHANNELFGGVGHGRDAHHALAAPEAYVVWCGISLHRTVAEVATKPLLHLQAAQIAVFAVSVLLAPVQRLVPENIHLVTLNASEGQKGGAYKYCSLRSDALLRQKDSEPMHHIVKGQAHWRKMQWINWLPWSSAIITENKQQMMSVVMFITPPLGANETFSRTIGPAVWPLPTVKPTYLNKAAVRRATSEKGSERTEGGQLRTRHTRRC
jgi:hypothetical protein